MAASGMYNLVGTEEDDGTRVIFGGSMYYATLPPIIVPWQKTSARKTHCCGASSLPLGVHL